MHGRVSRPGTRTPWIIPAILGGVVAATVVFGGLGLLFVALSRSDVPAKPAATAPATAEPPAPPASGLAALQGNWASNCEPAEDGQGSTSSVSVEGSSFSQEATVYSSAACTEPLFSVTAVMDLAAMNPRGGGTYDIDYRLLGVSYVPIARAAMFNRTAFLGSREWRDGVPRPLTPSEIEQLLGRGIHPGTITYDLGSIQENVFYSGKAAIGTTRAERPATVGGTRYFRQEEPP
jgi:hypothetical protein